METKDIDAKKLIADIGIAKAGQYLADAIKKHVVRIEFTKKDGTNRVLVGTTKPNHIPKDKKPTGDDTRKKSTEVVVVFDLDKSEWRSFRIDSLTKFRIVS